jgi:hypothetical protein
VDNYDLLSNSFNVNEKKELLILIRYVCIILKVHHNLHIELHPPRNTKEIFTYYSDKYWSKVLYAWDTIINSKSITKDIIYRAIHKGSCINHDYWYDIFKNNNILSENTDFINKFNNESNYYSMSSFNVKFGVSDELDKLITIDKSITDIFFHIRYLVLNKNYCKYMIEYVLDKKYISTYIIDIVYNYLSSDYIDPRLNSESEIEIVNLFKDFLDI